MRAAKALTNAALLHHSLRARTALAGTTLRAELTAPTAALLHHALRARTTLARATLRAELTATTTALLHHSLRARTALAGTTLRAAATLIPATLLHPLQSPSTRTAPFAQFIFMARPRLRDRHPVDHFRRDRLMTTGQRMGMAVGDELLPRRQL